MAQTCVLVERMVYLVYSACGDCHSKECLNAETVVVYNDDVTADKNSDTEDLFDEPLQTTDELAEQICFFDEVFEWEGEEEVVLSVAMNTST